MEIGGKTRICELRCAVVVIHEVDPSSGCVPDLPAWGQGTQLLTVDITQVPERDTQRTHRGQTGGQTGGHTGGQTDKRTHRRDSGTEEQ